MSMTSAEYRQLLEEEWHPSTREAFEQGLRAALKREVLTEKIGDRAREQGLVHKRQLEALREMRWLRGMQFEVEAWHARKSNPVRSPLLDDTERLCLRKRVAIEKRLRRARAEALLGCVMQTNWLKDHAELIAAVENYGNA